MCMCVCVIVFVSVCSQASRSRATLSCDSSYSSCKNHVVQVGSFSCFSTGDAARHHACPFPSNVHPDSGRGNRDPGLPHGPSPSNPAHNGRDGERRGRGAETGLRGRQVIKEGW